MVQSLRTEFPSLDLNALRMIIYAAVLIALMVWRPEGLLGERELFGKKRVVPSKPNKPKPGTPGEPSTTDEAKGLASREGEARS